MPGGKTRFAKSLDHGIRDLVRIVGSSTVGDTEIRDVRSAAGDERANGGELT
jgi:hypothetical protein